MAYEFFLSYARLDDGRQLVEQFWKDLQTRVIEKIGRGRDICFFDRESMPLGSKWREEIELGLRTSKVFVALISPGYIESEYCGKELAAFLRRVEPFEAALRKSGSPPSLIIPLMWTRPVDHLPAVLAARQYDHRALPQSYRDEELSILIDNSRYKDDYKDVITLVAEQIAAVIKKNPMPEASALPRLDGIESAFRSEGTPPPARRGPNNARFVFVAATPEEIAAFRTLQAPAAARLAIREHVEDHYGLEGGYSWRPFLPPEKTMSAGAIARNLAEKLRLHFSEMPVAADLVRRVQDAAAQNNVIAVVVDPCTLELPQYRQWMQDLDAWNTVSCSVVVPWNPQDETVTRFAERLDALIRQSFPARSLNSNPTYFQRIGSLDDMHERMEHVLTELRLNIIRNAEAAQIIDGPLQPPPSISNTSGTV